MLPSQRRDPDRLLPVEPSARVLARELYTSIAAAPIISPHGHVPAAMLQHDLPFINPSTLFIEGDHYITRLLHADGAPLELFTSGIADDPRAAWRSLADRWHLFDGTASGLWLEGSLSNLFGVDERLSASTADDIYDRIADQLSMPEFRPRALFERFGIELLATTDDPLDDLADHDALASSDLSGRVIPTFRPDIYLDPDSAQFGAAVDRLLQLTANEDSFEGYIAALATRREYFIRHGAISADHGVLEPLTLDLSVAEARALYGEMRRGGATPADRRRFRAFMLFKMAEMSADDGLVMTIHAGVMRNHHASTLERFGPDTGHDIPVPTTFVSGLQPMLERFGTNPGFQVILFTTDESSYSREIAPLAGFYPSVFIGAPWWFLDAPLAIERFRGLVSETAGFYRGSGFIDDTRSFLSVPARHDTSRRVDAAFLARMVLEGRIARDRAFAIARDTVDAIPRRAFRIRP